MTRKKQLHVKPDIKQIIDKNLDIIDAMKKLSIKLHEHKIEKSAKDNRGGTTNN